MIGLDSMPSMRPAYYEETDLAFKELQDFARALIELDESEQLWNRLSQNGIRKTRALYSTEAARKKLEFLFSDEHLRHAKQSLPIAKPELVG
jgi:hypothetical protein